jgi:hypothetical protein
MHYFEVEGRRLACGFVAAHVNWTLNAGAVDCPDCREVLDRRAAQNAWPHATATAPNLESSIASPAVR